VAEGQLGDLLILSPALRALKESFPSASLTVLVLQRRSYDGSSSAPRSVLSEDVQGGTAAVLRSDPNVARVAEIDRQTLRALGGLPRARAELSVHPLAQAGEIRHRHMHIPQDRFYLWAFLSGARVRVGEEGSPFLCSSRTGYGIRRARGGCLHITARLRKRRRHRQVAEDERCDLPRAQRAGGLTLAFAGASGGETRRGNPSGCERRVQDLAPRQLRRPHRPPAAGGDPGDLTGSSYDSEVLGEGGTGDARTAATRDHARCA